MVTNLLEQEMATYAAQRSMLLGTAEGKYVLISKDQVIGVFDSQYDAIRQGYQQLGNIAFLVKKIDRIESPLNFTTILA